MAVYVLESVPLSSAGNDSAPLVGLVADEGDNHAVKVEEEHDQVEAKLHK